MKHMFQLIPRGSSNSMLQDTGLEKKMRKSCLIALLLTILVTSSVIGQVEAGIAVSSQYVKPGDNVELIIKGTPGSNFTVIISNSRTMLGNVSQVMDETGQYSWIYTVNETTSTDNFKVNARINGVDEETQFVVSKIEPAILANTLRTMAENSKRQAQTAMIEAKRKGNLNTDMVVAYRDALQALDESQQFAGQGEHTRAFESIREALSRFESIIHDYYLERNPPEKPVSETKMVRATEAVRALHKSVSELNNTSITLKRKGFNVDSLEKGLKNMIEGIRKAETDIKSGNIEDAVSNIQSATQTRTRIQEALRKRLQELNQGKIQNYQNTIVKRYTSMQNTLTTLQTVNSDRVSGALSDLNAIESKLDYARNLFEQGKYSDSIRALQSADMQFKETFNGLNGERTKTLLGTLDKLASELEKEPSLVTQERIQKQMDTITNSLRNRLQVESTTTTRPSVRKTPAINTPTVSP